MYRWCAGLDLLLCMCVYSCGQQMLWTVRARGGHWGQEHCFDGGGRRKSCWFACRFIFSASPPLLHPPPWASPHHIPFFFYPFSTGFYFCYSSSVTTSASDKGTENWHLRETEREEVDWGLRGDWGGGVTGRCILGLMLNEAGAP